MPGITGIKKFRESAPNQILIFGEPPPRVVVSENVRFSKFECADRAGGHYETLTDILGGGPTFKKQLEAGGRVETRRWTKFRGHSLCHYFV